MLWFGHEEFYLMTQGFVSLKEINLLPWREELKEFQRKQFVFFLGFSAASSLFIIIMLHIFFAGRNNQQLARNDYLNQQIAIAAKEVAEIDELSKEKQQLVERMAIIQRLQENRPNVVKIFDGMVKTVPEGLYLTNVNRIKSKINIQGKAESNIRVSTFMRNIEASNWLTHPILSFIEAEEDKNKERSKEDNKSKVQNQATLSEQGILFNLNAQQTFMED
jgi:type IV pilus assembly protein PilN